MEEEVLTDEHRELLKKKVFAHVATIGPKGEPQSSPVWVDLDAKYVVFSNTKSRQKYRNLKRDPRVSLSIIDPDNPYHYIEIRGVVQEIEADPQKELINALAKKYMNVDKYPYDTEADERVKIKIKPIRVLGMG